MDDVNPLAHLAMRKPCSASELGVRLHAMVVYGARTIFQSCSMKANPNICWCAETTG